MATTDAEEFADLRAFDRYEPIGRQAEILAQGFAAVVNLLLAMGGVKGSRCEAGDFLPPGTIRPTRTADPAAMEGAMRQSAEAEWATRGRRR